MYYSFTPHPRAALYATLLARLPRLVIPISAVLLLSGSLADFGCAFSGRTP